MTLTDNRTGLRRVGSKPGAAQRGGALLAVLWLSAALAAIAFSVATTVRGETERTATDSEGTRAYFLATGAIDRAMNYLEWAKIFTDSQGQPRYFRSGQPDIQMEFPTGHVSVQVLPATGFLNINQARPEDIFRVMLTVGASPDQARAFMDAVVARRTPIIPMAGSTFVPAPASFQEIEELLRLPGMTPELFYGSYVRDNNAKPPRLVAKGGFRDCVSLYGVQDNFDVNSAAPDLLLAIGLAPSQVNALVANRPFPTIESVQQFIGGDVIAMSHLRVGGNTIFTLRAVAQLRHQDGKLSDLKRTVAATVKFYQIGGDPAFLVLRWYDRA